MAVRTLVIPQRDFSGGEVDAEARRRDDTKLQRSSLRTGKNLRSRNAGGVSRRPGSRHLFLDEGRPAWVRPTSNVRHKLSFTANTFTARNNANAIVTQLTGCPWSAAQVKELVWIAANERVFVAHRSFPTQVFTWDGTAWHREAFAFISDLNGTIRQPYYRFAGQGVTMTPSGLTGSITVNFSANVLIPGHVGVRFRYNEREIVITAVTNGTTGTATVIDALPPTYSVEVSDNSAFSVGDVVEGSQSGARGQVIAKPSPGHLDIVMINNFSGFQVSPADYIVGPHGQSPYLSKVQISPGASTVWDEQFISAARGYPGSVFFDVQRVGFCDFAQLGNGVIWGAVGSPFDMSVTEAADGAIFETVPVNCTVYFVVGGADEFVFTNIGVFFVPISGGSPLAPGSVEFRQIGSDGIARIQPVATTEGISCISAGLNRVLTIIPTGQTARPYLVEDISQFHTHLIRSPVSLGATSGDGATPERYLFVVNADGTMAVGRYNKTEDWVGFYPWSGVAAVRWIATDQSDVLVSAEYPLAGGSITSIEMLDDAMLVDGVVPLEDSDLLAEFAGLDVSIFDEGGFRGIYPVGVDGTLTGWSGDTDGVSAGFNFEVRGRPFMPNLDEAESVQQRLRRRRVKRAALVVNSTTGDIEWCGRLIAGYGAGEDDTDMPEERETTHRARILGRSWEPNIEFVQRFPGKLTVVEIATEVTV
jgi:hypothetical protein